MPGAGTPESAWVPASQVTPWGRAPDSAMVGTGKPLAVTVKLPGTPTSKVAASAEVSDGGSWTVTSAVSVTYPVDVVLPIS